MIKNADLYDLINISLRANELKDEQVEMFIQKALMTSHRGRPSDSAAHEHQQWLQH